MAKYTVSVMYSDGRINSRDFLHWHIASSTISSLALIARRYPGTIKNLWIS